MTTLEQKLTQENKELYTPLLSIIDRSEKYILKPELLQDYESIFSLHEKSGLGFKLDLAHKKMFKQVRAKKTIAVKNYFSSDNSVHDLSYELLKAKYNVVINALKFSRSLLTNLNSNSKNCDTLIYLNMPKQSNPSLLIDTNKTGYKHHEILFNEITNSYYKLGVNIYLNIK